MKVGSGGQAEGSKVVEFDNISSVLDQYRSDGQAVVQCHGVFDIVHPGHIQHLKEAAEQGDVLVVSITSDQHVNRGPGRPVFDESLRATTLAAFEFVDFVVVIDHPTAIEAIETIAPTVYVKGSDYSEAADDLTGMIGAEVAAVEKHGGSIHYTGGEVFSSSSLANNFFSNFDDTTKTYLKDLSTKYTSDDVFEVFDRVSEMSVLVIGETIIDQYTYCIPLAKAPREFIMSVKSIEDELFVGGSAAIANHVAGIAKNVTLISIFGDDEYSEMTESGVSENVALRSIICPGRPTVRKQRFLDPNFYTKMFEVQHLDDTELDPEQDGELLDLLRFEIDRHDIVMVSDFGHGMMSKEARDLITASQKFVGVNTQTNSANFGYNTVERYKRANYVSIDLPELRLAARDKHGDPAELANAMATELQAEGFMVTLGREGSVYTYEKSKQMVTPAVSGRVIDRVGAGDAFYSLSAPCVAAGAPPELVGFIGNCAGALAVGIIGNRDPIDPVNLKKFILRLLKK